MNKHELALIELYDEAISEKTNQEIEIRKMCLIGCD